MNIKLISSFFIVFIFTLFINGCSLGKPYAVKIGSDSVSVEEFKFYFLLSQHAYEEEGGIDIWETTINGLKAEEAAKERALESLTVVKITGKQVRDFGVRLTEEDEKKAVDMTAAYKTSINEADLAEIGISNDQMQNIMEETILYRKVYNEVVKNVIVSENDFNEYFKVYTEENKVDVTDVSLNELRQAEYDKYSYSVMNDVFDEQFSRWSANTKIVKNNEIWETIKILKH